MIIFRIIIILTLFLSPNLSACADFPCAGKMINPITDICWSCLLPISIGNIKVAKGSGVKNRDTNNPSNPLCLCTKNNIPIPGVSIGFSEPVRLVDVTRTPFCMVNLGGIQIQNHKQTKVSSYQRGYGKHHAHHSFYHVHYYIYPLIYWLELITDFLCLEQATFDVAYLSEYDITWNDEKLQMLTNPESFLFGSPIAQSACALDCAAATTNLPIDSLFWCAGCLGNIYPFSGANADHVGGIQNSSLLTARILAKMHRSGLLEETSTDDGSINGKLCRKNLHFLPKKSQYKLQLTNPSSTSGNLGCWPLGLSDILYSSFKEYPGNGQDFGYLIWRKRNCCLL
ncbi:MAG: conjugal transfer pilus assembly protein TraU [Rickettsiaceae bacterium]|nr:conjugal transfer pilus assembly protein TraU [Rickettsiaceae bacterium]